MAIPNARKWLGERPGLDFEDDLSKVVAKASALILVTSWDEYRQLPELIVAASEPPLLVDGRRFLPKSSVPYYSGIGL
jgi:UDP-glucose 6-dehydrogenase